MDKIDELRFDVETLIIATEYYLYGQKKKLRFDVETLIIATCKVFRVLWMRCGLM